MKAFRFVGLGTAIVLGVMALAWQQEPPRPPDAPRAPRDARPVPPPVTQDADIERLRREAEEAEAAGRREQAQELRAMIQKLQEERGRRNERNQDRMLELKRLEDELRAAGPDTARGRELQDRVAALRGSLRLPGYDDMMKQIDDVRDLLRQLDPATLQHIEKLLGNSRIDEAFKIAQDARARTRDLKEMQERDPEGFKKMMEARTLERETEELGAMLRKAPADKKAELKDKMAKAVSRLFDLREEMRAKELEDLKKRIDELNGLLAKRKASREKIIERRVRQLSGEPDELDW